MVHDTITNSFDDGRTSKHGVIIEPKTKFDPGKYTIKITNQGSSPVHVYGSENGSLNAFIWKRTYIAHLFFSASLFILAFAGIAV